MNRIPVLLLTSLGVCLAFGGCGEEAPEISADDIVREREAEQRDEEIARVKRRLALERRLERQGTQPSESEGPSDALPEFNDLLSSLGGTAGATLGPPGAGAVAVVGDFVGGSAWSTIKVAIAIRVIERAGGPSRLSGSQRALIERALTASDNDAAAQLFSSLGSPTQAAAEVTQVLRQAGDATTQVSSVGRDGFSPYGQTDWSLEAQHRFMSALAGGCLGDAATREYILGLMGRVTSDSWGLGSAGASARWKGGWGPGTDGRYLARQMGVLEVNGRQLVVTLAVVPDDGHFASAQSMATQVAQWLVQHGSAYAKQSSSC